VTPESRDRNVSHGAVLDALAQFLVAQPTALRALLTDHVDDGRGGCRRCPIGGQRGNQKWPCVIHVAAIRASELSVQSERERLSLIMPVAAPVPGRAPS
jgi:hypothetical protein